MTVSGMTREEAKDLAMHFLTKVRIPDQAEKFPGSSLAANATRCHCARAVHAAKDYAVRRADLGT